ncbi:MAG TPA: DUF503 domain-containing protein [Roseiflexaceae bacterium]|nr:DUF503 domain-containing protein [Roseiflexaceae bacterium]HMP38966.1 DUF503 domain-containing protein [Roseiflexaceae bacterium]
MVVASCLITLYLPGVHSLKEKRSIVKSLIGRIRSRFNVSIAEVAAQDLHARAVIGVACVSGSAEYARGQLDALVRWIETERPDLTLLDADIELY